uniref:Uncharacterized protein n=1 Tax=Proboscia inermis TaxID=420281 RepID=A0A7S0G7K5_9STRA|mmetsp:Transcript_15505/g.15707  ORF Transcript_15505/g.15707 Transcript_15505/m.15707 type:complete len:117 (+) Transcript_15505:957-1307(+)
MRSKLLTEINRLSLFRTSLNPRENSEQILTYQNVVIKTPEFIVSKSHREDNNWKKKRESYKQQSTLEASQKQKLAQARSQWLESEFSKIKQENYTPGDFLIFVKKNQITVSICIQQ